MTSFFTCPDLPKHKFTFTVVRMREPHVFLLPDELQLCRDKGIETVQSYMRFMQQAAASRVRNALQRVSNSNPR